MSRTIEKAAFRFRRAIRLNWVPGRRQLATQFGEPLFFHHVAKTGGTSLIKAVRSVTPRRLTCSEDGDLSAAFVAGLIARGLARGQFIYGHPHTGAATPLRGRAVIVSLLREPRDQAISCYLHVRTHRTVPDYRVARELDFREFLLARPYFAIFQTASLHVGIEERPLARTEDLIDRLPSILAYLREIKFLGTLNTAERLLSHLGAAMQWPAVPAFPHRRKSRLSSARRALMREQYDELRHHPALASLLAAEQATYEAVRNIETSSPWGSV